VKADPEWFAGRLREMRERADLSRKELADRAGLSEGGVRDLEQAHRRPSWETVLALCGALAVDPNAFAQPPAQTTEKPKRGRPKKSGQAEGELPEERDRALRETLADPERRYQALPPAAPEEETGEEPPAVKKSGKRGGKRKEG
jgi:transcriptional regulator with XRE-family HTH domain